MYVKAGFPADGLADFLRRYLEAWGTATQKGSIEAICECLTDDLVFADSITGCRDWSTTQAECDLYHLLVTYSVIPFYPQDDTHKSLPLFDFFEGNVRVTVPWRGKGYFAFSPKRIDRVGVDRYNLIRDPARGWLISRIDTDYDILAGIVNVLPLPLHAVKQQTFGSVLKAAQKFLPFLRGPKIEAFRWK
ncbi:hypothetical protein BI330_06025 [Mycobacterium sp. CBMA 623]|nr:hypothetical protein [Mycobacteroides sp. CBMA 326]